MRHVEPLLAEAAMAWNPAEPAHDFVTPSAGERGHDVLVETSWTPQLAGLYLQALANHHFSQKFSMRDVNLPDVRSFFLFLSRSKTLRKWMETSPLARRLATRFVDGETLDQALD